MARQSRYGSGSIRRKGEGRWELRVSAGRDPATGPVSDRAAADTMGEILG
ncbi:MAG: hypothetical protein OEY23_23645 [Acidimicrobiia bacterium]|nr:hypothetical protein [Acidimicrobiia bacterium]